jgi:hypothetical protein
MKTTVLYRPVGPVELELVVRTGSKRFPPRLPEQPIFYPVTNVEYARQIARDWNHKRDGGGYVLRFAVDSAFLERYPIQQVGAAIHREYWVPAEDLEAFNDHIVGLIELIESYPAPDADLQVKLVEAHKFCTNNRSRLLESEICGCFYCRQRFSPQRVVEWIDHDTTALCPECGIDSLIAASSGVPLTDEFLEAMYEWWFATTIDAKDLRL